MTLNQIRTSDFWIINANAVTHGMSYHCVTCRRLPGKIGEQKMAELPFDRLQEESPFTYCGVDLFGPFTIKVKSREIKRYGVMFTCLSSRANHLDNSNSLEIDSFVLALRRFVG